MRGARFLTSWANVRAGLEILEVSGSSFFEEESDLGDMTEAAGWVFWVGEFAARLRGAVENHRNGSLAVPKA